MNESLFLRVSISSVAQSCLTLCDLMDCSTPGFPVHHQLLKPTQTHVHCVRDAIQPSRPLSSLSPPAFNLSQHQGLSQWVLCIRWPKYWRVSIVIYYTWNLLFSLLSRVQLFVTPWTAALQASLPFTISWSLLKFMSIESVISSNHLILCHPLLLLPSIFPSIRVFSKELALCIRWPM